MTSTEAKKKVNGVGLYSGRRKCFFLRRVSMISSGKKVNLQVKVNEPTDSG